MERAKPSVSLSERLLQKTKGCIRSLVWRCKSAITSDLLQDLEQEARLTLWRALPRLSRLPSPAQEAYAARTVRRAVIRAIRRELRQRQGAVSTEDPSVSELAPADSADEQSDAHQFTPDELAARFENPRLTEAFLSLPADDQTTLMLKFVHQYDDAEIAAHLNTTPGAATKRRQRALERLRIRLGETDQHRTSPLPA